MYFSYSIGLLFAKLIQMAVSRKREFLADASGALLTRYPEGLANALEKISSQTVELKRANKATAHLYISSPFKGKGMSKMFSTHPPAAAIAKANLHGTYQAQKCRLEVIGYVQF